MNWAKRHIRTANPYWTTSDPSRLVNLYLHTYFESLVINAKANYNRLSLFHLQPWVVNVVPWGFRKNFLSNVRLSHELRQLKPDETSSTKWKH
ncbi:CLUMA_CG020032, isoform A [Clunio marinus]|uniref:CLUMA_CG020032, isoform A n=1 Tax=Clunio marinus TaxID=568069 RepID=A0A1J1J4S9_9DIPT|nr:CLUMA_CG020032, isoform A [Clunio marinus]